MSVREIVDDRRSGAARARPRGDARGAALARDPGADRRPDRDDARGQRRRAGGEPGRRAGADRRRRGRRRQPALPVQAADPADRDRQPGDRAARRRDGRDQRGLPVGAGPARRSSSATSTIARALPRPRRRSRTTRSSAGSPRAPSSTRSTTSTACCSSTGADPRTLTTWEQFERFHRDDVRRADHRVRRAGRDRDRRVLVRAGLARRRRAPSRASLIEVDGDRIAAVEPRRRGRRRAPTRLAGLTLPGFANAHSHAFHRALRGRTQAGRGLVLDLARADVRARRRGSTPTRYLALARATFAEMALAGITAVGEFHYLHHGPGGDPYDDPNAMGAALIAGGARGRHPDHAARRLLPARRHRRAARATRSALRRRRRRRLGRARRRARATATARGSARRSTACARSTRSRRAVVAAWASERERAAARPRLRAAGRERGVPRRVRRDARRRCSTDAGALGERFTAVHATHLTDDDVALLGGAAARCCLCPTTERDLADGIGRGAALARRRARRWRSAPTRTR